MINCLGSYGAIESGEVCEALVDLTGEPGTTTPCQPYIHNYNFY